MVLKLELKGKALLKPVANVFGFFVVEVFANHLKRLKEIRNRCAHNGRIFNRNYRGVKIPAHHSHFFQSVGNHSSIHTWMTLLLLAGHLDRYVRYEDFEREELFKLLAEVKSSRQINAMLSELPKQFGSDEYLKLSKFILNGMGKR
ncbi:MAG: Abi family protein [Campylobacterales bacterium]